MRKLCILMALCVVFGLFLAGCGTVDSFSERNRRYAQITGVQMRQAVDDWDTFWLMDHSTRLSQWDTRVGE